MSESPIKTAKFPIIMTFVMVALLALLSNMPEPVDPYCEMVQIYIDSNGEYGWPDYRGNEECGNER